jgi:hypothetical protein
MDNNHSGTHLNATDSHVPDRHWRDRGLSASQELQLYFGIVACHASHLSQLFLRRASQFLQLRESCKLYSKHLQDMSKTSLFWYFHRQRYFVQSDVEISEYDKKFVVEASSWLKTCVRQYRMLDSICQVISPQPGMENLTWDMIVVRTIYGGQLETEQKGLAAANFMTIIDCANTCLENATTMSCNWLYGIHPILWQISYVFQQGHR